MKRNKIAMLLCMAVLTGCSSAVQENTSDSVYAPVVSDDTGTNVTPTSNENYFIWSGNSIIGLTEDGRKQKELVIPEKCDAIDGPILFENENSVESIRFESDKDISINGSLGNSENLKSIVLPSELSAIGNMEFWLCSSLEEIVIPGTVKEIGKYAFKDCTALKKVVIQEGTTTILNDAFYGCTNLETLELPDTLTTIEDGAFQNCKSLKDVAIPKSLKNVGAYAFANGGLERLTIPEEVVFEEYDQSSFGQADHVVHVSSPEGSWIDQNFESVFYTFAVKD